MAIYKNREVTIGAITQPVHRIPDEIIYIWYPDGNGENVRLGDVYFTEDEKKSLQKNYPSKYDGVNTVKDEDIKAVRLGIPPSYDTSADAVAEAQALRQLAVEANAKDTERRKAEAVKKLNVNLNKTTVSSPNLNTVKVTQPTPNTLPERQLKTGWTK